MKRALYTRWKVLVEAEFSALVHAGNIFRLFLAETLFPPKVESF